MMASASYTARRDALETYFDRTAIEAWKAFATDAPVSRIRQTVRAGRAEMRVLMLAQLPRDLSGWRILDAGCGTGAMTVELARRGAGVTAVDLSPGSIEFARENWPGEVDDRRVRFAAGDMLDASLGEFDAVVAMDSLIHYAMPDVVASLLALMPRVRRRIVMTHAPATPMLRVMHAAGQLFPKRDRSPAIVPVVARELRSVIENAARDSHSRGELEAAWAAGATRVVSSGFYTSQMLVLHSDRDAEGAA